MAINKTINKSTKSHGAMRNCMEYVLREHKTDQSLCYVTGPFQSEQITYDTVYQSFLTEKKLWHKDSGRMYAHNIISWHKDEAITLEEAYEFGKEFAEKWFDGFQTLLTVHMDREHVHLHLVTNTVSYLDGHKLHTTKHDLEGMKNFTNQMCEERGLTVAKKGKDFYGRTQEEGHVTAWTKDKYHLLLNETKKSYVADCAIAIMEVMEGCTSKDEFVAGMKEKGWKVRWTQTRKNITFTDGKGRKVRDKNLAKTFHMDISKEALLYEFERANKERRAQLESLRRENEREQYYREVIAAAGRDGADHREIVERFESSEAGKYLTGEKEYTTGAGEEGRGRKHGILEKISDERDTELGTRTREEKERQLLQFEQNTRTRGRSR